MEPTEMNIHDSYKLAISCVSYVLNISLNKNHKDKNCFVKMLLDLTYPELSGGQMQMVAALHLTRYVNQPVKA
jgi:hypothetical protein